MQKLAAGHAIVALLGLAAAAPVRAAAGEAPAAAPVLARIFRYYQGLKDFSAAFHQTKVLRAEGLELPSSGVLKVSIGQALLWEVTEPGPLAVFLDAGTLRIRSGAGASATTTTYDLKTSAYSEKIAESMRELTALLAMNRAALAASYDVALDQGALVLTPKTPRQFSRVRMTLADAAWIKRLEIDELSQDRMLLDFSAPKQTTTRWVEAWTKGG